MAEVQAPISISKMVASNALAGGFSGIIADVVFYQLELYKTREQVLMAGQTLAPLRSKYQGFFVNTVAAFPANAVYFIGYMLGKRLYRDNVVGRPAGPKEFNFMESACGGVLSEVFNNAVRTPLEQIKTRIQTGDNLPILRTLKEIYRARGFRGLYAGWGPLMLRDVPFSVVQFSVYDLCRTSESVLAANDLLTSGVRGFICGVVATLFSHPFDVVKTLAMTSDGLVKLSNTTAVLWRSGGVKKLYKGLVFRSLYMGATTAILFMFYDKLCDYFEEVL